MRPLPACLSHVRRAGNAARVHDGKITLRAGNPTMSILEMYRRGALTRYSAFRIP